MTLSHNWTSIWQSAVSVVYCAFVHSYDVFHSWQVSPAESSAPCVQRGGSCAEVQGGLWSWRWLRLSGRAWSADVCQSRELSWLVRVQLSRTGPTRRTSNVIHSSWNFTQIDSSVVIVPFVPINSSGLKPFNEMLVAVPFKDAPCAGLGAL